VKKLIYIITLVLLCFYSLKSKAQFIHGDDCSIDWVASSFGEYFKLFAHDYLNDGSIDLYIFGYHENSDLPSLNVLSFNSANQDYEVVHSIIFETQNREIIIEDINNDGVKEILAANWSELYIINADNLNFVNKIEEETSAFSSKYFVGDINNDGATELIVTDVFGDLKVYETEYFFQKLNIEDGFNKSLFKIDDIDNDSIFEVVDANGRIVEIDYLGIQTVQSQPSIGLNANLAVELEDLNNDGFKEGIFVNTTGGIVIYDLNNDETLATIPFTSEIYEFYMEDFTNNGIRDIVFSDCTNSCTYRIYNTSTFQFINSLTGTEENFGLTAADFDGNGTTEFAYGNEETFNGPSNVFIKNALSNDVLYKSTFIFGTTHAMDIADINGDGNEEIVTVSYGHGSDTYTRSILTIYNKETKEQLHQSNTSSYDQNFFRISHLEIFDHQNDGDLEIVCAGSHDQHIFYVLNGSDYTIEDEIDYDSLGEIYDLELFDIDNDNVDELLVFLNDRIAALSTIDFSVKWESDEILVPSIASDYRRQLKVGDVNGDMIVDLIASFKKLYIFEGGTMNQFESEYDAYTDFTLYDFDGNGDVEIFSLLDNSANGVFLDGLSFEHGDTIPIQYGSQNIEIEEINDAGDLIFAFTSYQSSFSSPGYVYLANQSGANLKNTGNLGDFVGYHDAFRFIENNNGEKSLLIGTGYGLIDLNLNCAKCIPFSTEVQVNNESCYGNDGSILINSNLQNPEYHLDGEPVTDSIGNLIANNYTIKVVGSDGCENLLSAEIINLYEEFDGMNLFINSKNQDTVYIFSDEELRVSANGGFRPFEFIFYDNNYNLIDTITDSSCQNCTYVELPEHGEYIIAAQDTGGCRKESYIIYTDEEPNVPELENVEVYPNLLQDEILFIKNLENYLIKSYNLSSFDGKVVKNKVVQSNATDINLYIEDNLVNGYYILTLLIVQSNVANLTPQQIEFPIYIHRI